MINEKIAYLLLGVAIAIFFFDYQIFMQNRKLTWRLALALILLFIGVAMSGVIQDFMQGFTKGFNDGNSGNTYRP
jgi:ABC-type lipoprotein release transport system permease subunit